MRCPHCQTENPPTTQRCSSCGATLNDQHNAERKLVTVLYADLVGHTEIETRTDPEEWRTLLQAYFAEMAKPIARYGGTVEKFIGDAIFAVFGVPRIHEDDAERAVRAAEGMQAALGRLNPLFTRRLGAPLGMRIALVTGEVVAPRETKTDQLVSGDLTSLAERLQKAAPPNSIVLSDRTYQLVASLVEAESLGELTLRGFPDQQRAFLLHRVLREVGRPWRARVSGPLIGREKELGVLAAARDRLIAGQGQVVVIVGDAGLGKSRLVAELRTRVDTELPFLEARCHQVTQATTYGAAVQHFREYLEVAEPDPPEVGRVQLEAALSRLFGGAASPDVRQGLTHLLGIEEAHQFEDLTRGLGPDEIRALIVRAITGFWEAVGSQGPLVLVVEDLQWVDAASAALLGELLQVVDRAPLMLLCTFRPERRSLAWEFKVAAERDYPHRYHEVRLAPLSVEETEHLAHALLERLGLPTDLKRQVAQRAEGIPFYVEEVAQSLQQQGSALQTAPRLPDTLRGVLLARLDELPGPARRVVQAASVIGRTFSLRLLKAASGTDGELGVHLSILQRTDLIHEERRLPEPEFAFKHVLLQETAYNTLLQPQRRDFHRRVGEAIEQESVPSQSLPLLVRHFVQGEVWEKAFVYAVKAGEAARGISALEDALEHYEVALRIARDHPEQVADQSRLLGAQKARGEVLSFLGRYDAAVQHFEELLAHSPPPTVRAQIYRGIGRLYSQKGDLRKAQTNLERALRLFKRARNPEEEIRAYRDLAFVMERRRDYARALEYAQQALSIAEESALQTQATEVYHVLAITHLYGGDVAESIRYGEHGLRLAVRSGGQLEVVQARNDLAYILHLGKGEVNRALDQAHEAVAMATRLGLPVPLVVSQDTLGEIMLAQGRLEDAASLYATIEDGVRRYALGTRWQAVVHRGYGFVSLAREDWEEAIRRLEESKSLDEKTGIVRNLPRIHLGLAEAHLGLRDLPTARVHADKVMHYERSANPLETPMALRVLAVIAREQGHVKRAVRLLGGSRSLMKMRKGSSEYARVLIELCKAYAATGQKRQARKVGEEGIRISAAIGAGRLLEEAQQLVRQL